MKRLDVALTELSLAKSRTAAQTLIKAGCVTVNGKKAEKPSGMVDEADKIEVSEAESVLKYVGRGGFKLEHAIETFGIDLRGKVCLDIGASTGGFTDCMLKNGAKRVFAVDVGHGQLAKELLADERVVSLEGLDIRSAGAEITEAADFISVDVSFISLKLILPELKRFAAEKSECAALIKPQFENGRRRNGKNGVIRDEKTHKRIVGDISEFALACGYKNVKVAPSPVTGGDGNREFLMYFCF